MASFQITLTPSRRAATRFIADVRRKVKRAFAERQKDVGLTQSAVAKLIGVHRSVINRELRGTENMTLGRIGELSWAFGMEPHFELRLPNRETGVNINTIMPNASDKTPIKEQPKDSIAFGSS
jgi:plasmid maintenance system antidote protein VapI